MEDKKHILVVDDEEALCEALSYNLEAAGYEVDTAHSAEEALAKNPANYDLILLDIMMGDISGLQLLRIMKKNEATAEIPVIFCTARDSEEDMIGGLDLGADDYIMKPYSLAALLARVRTVLRRGNRRNVEKNVVDEQGDVRYGGLVLSTIDKSCHVDGNEVKMPKKEFELLLKLMNHRGKIFSRAELLDAVWPEEVVVVDRVVDVNITRIRRKIGAYGKHIVTKSGYGYGFME